MCTGGAAHPVSIGASSDCNDRLTRYAEVDSPAPDVPLAPRLQRLFNDPAAGYPAHDTVRTIASGT